MLNRSSGQTSNANPLNLIRIMPAQGIDVPQASSLAGTRAAQQHHRPCRPTRNRDMTTIDQATPHPGLDAFYPLVASTAALASVLPAGVRLAQLRIKDKQGQALLDELAQARELCAAAACTLVVNDFWREAIETGCSYVHLGQEDLDTADLAALRTAGVRIGISTHDEAELARALAAEPDYIALGPIFPTGSKQLHWAAQGIDRIRHWKRQIGSRPLVAIGGLTLETAAPALAAGADSLAVIGDVMNHPDPAQRCREWLAAINAAQA